MKTEREVIDKIQAKLKEIHSPDMEHIQLIVDATLEVLCDNLCRKGDLGCARWFREKPGSFFTFQVGPRGLNDGVATPRLTGEWIISQNGRTAFRVRGIESPS